MTIVVSTSAGRSAARRRNCYEQRFAAQANSETRRQLWALVGWLLSEGLRQPLAEQPAYVADLHAWLVRWNERSANRDRE